MVVVGGAGECAGEIAEEVFQFALCACEGIEAQSQLSLDAFDSTLGGYAEPIPGGTNLFEDGNLGLNSGLQMTAKLEVLGSAYTGGGGFAVGPSSRISKTLYAAGTATQANASTEIGRNAFVDGNVVGRFNINGDLTVPAGAQVSNQTENALGGQLIRGSIPASRPCACDPGELLDIAGLTSWAANNNDNRATGAVTSTTWENGEGPNQIVLPCGRYYLSEIDHPGPLNIIAEGRTVLFVDGDMRIGGQLNLQLMPGAEIDLFVAGSLSVQASARFGDENAPSKVRTYVGGADTIALGASTVFGGNLYAPRAEVIFGASAELYGALFARRAQFSGSASVHFDRAVRSAGDSCEEPEPPMDAGVADTGIADGGPDAGTPDLGAPDTGVADQGTPDMGEMMCNSCGDCPQSLGCVIPEGQNSGTCGACEDDLDCCAPLLCVQGTCMLQL